MARGRVSAKSRLGGNTGQRCVRATAPPGRAPVSSPGEQDLSRGCSEQRGQLCGRPRSGPAALRSAGLLEQLIASGLRVHDDGNLPHQIWSPDRDHPLAQNAGQATTSLQQLADRLHPLLACGDIALVLGGNCTIALGVVAALRRLGAGAPGLLYADRHYDLNTPESTTHGALDWMGLAHALALPGCLDTLTGAFGAPAAAAAAPGDMARGRATGGHAVGA